MIDDIDSSESTLHLLASQALKQWNTLAILQLILDKDYRVRTLAARELQIRGDKIIYTQLKNMIHHQEAYIREICAFTLGQLGTPNMPFKEESFPLLLPLLKDSDADVRSAAIAAIGHLSFAGMPEYIENSLLFCVNDENTDVRACLAYALGHSSGSQKAIDVLEQLRQDNEEDVRSYAELGFELLDGK